MATEHSQEQKAPSEGGQQSHGSQMYVRFGAMIFTAMVVMYDVMFMGTYEWGHVQWSESRLFMALAMGATMGLVMLGWMLNMYDDIKMNLAIVGVSLLLLVGAVFLDRSQTTVQDNSFMSAMIPHHSLAITRAERSELADVRVCELAIAISEAQKREIAEMEWLISDIKTNGPAATPAEADARSVPDFEGVAERQCATG